VEGVYTEFYSCGKVPSSSGHMSVYSMYTGRIKGYTECDVGGMFTDFVYLVNNESWFLTGMKLVCGTLGGRVFRYANLRYQISRTPNYDFRNAKKTLLLLKPRTDYLKPSFSYNGAILWNNLPENIRTSNSLSFFKRSSHRWFSDQYSNTANM